MEHNLRQLVSCLDQASGLVTSILDNEQNVATTSRSASTSTTNSSSARAGSASSSPGGIGISGAFQTLGGVSGVMNRARTMIQQSSRGGMYSRLGQRQRERLRGRATAAASSSNEPRGKKQRSGGSKVFEFVLMQLEEVDEQAICEESVVLRGFVDVNTNDNEDDIRGKLRNAIRIKYPLIEKQDFHFLRANRRKLSVPVSCEQYSYKQLKLLAGQGCIYLKLKEGFDCLLCEGGSDNDEEMAHSPFTDTEAATTSATTAATVTTTATPVATTAAASATYTATAATTSIAQQSDEAFDEIDDLARQAVLYCKTHGIENPVEILRYYQKIMVYGRAIQIQDESQLDERTTNFILVDRNNLVHTAFDEIKSLKELRKTLEVQFYGEEAEDYGGPRKEFFCLILREIYVKYFEKGLKEHIAEDYNTVGIVLGLSILQDGKLPQFLDENVLQEIFAVNVGNQTEPTSCIDNLRLGFQNVGIYQIASQMPIFLHLLRPGSMQSLTVKSICNILKPQLSEEGSNSRKQENAVYAVFLKYLREVASGRRVGITLASILQFATGADEEPVLGFGIPPTLVFYEVQKSFLPTANTCVSSLKLPRPSSSIPLPDIQDLLSLYDLAFVFWDEVNCTVCNE